MPASRWNANLIEIIGWMEAGYRGFHDLLFTASHPEVPAVEAGQTEVELKDGSEITPPLPAELPVLPLRGLVVYPQTAVPLTIGQPRSIRLVDDVIVADRLICLVAAKNPDLENPEPEDLYNIGTAATIHRLFRAPDGTIRLLVQGLSRLRIGEFTSREPYLKAKVESFPEVIESDLEIEALARNARDQFEHIAKMIPSIPRELVDSITSITEPLQTAYTIANFQRMEVNDSQKILDLDPIGKKLHLLVGILARETEVLDLGQKIQNEARSEIEKVQREYFLREQLKAIQKELGEGDEQTADVEEFRKKIQNAGMTEESGKQASRELDRLTRLPSAAAEYGVIRTYLEWLVSLPWSTTTEDNLDLSHARTVLEEDHYGLKDVKERVVEFLAVRKRRSEQKDKLVESFPKDYIRREREGVILCFVGPPGVGKTSLGQSISRALGRKFVRISLGGLRDEAEIRGHRRTYIGALPGRILQSLRRVETRNPVFMLDEIDKLSHDFLGDPASALLEVLDPEQNSDFRDHYLEVAFDLSQVMFITTANSLETIPGALLDRMEVIQLSGYTEGEKTAIAKQYLIPRQLRESGLSPEEVSLSEGAIQTIIRLYTREAGVRNLERMIGSVFRKIVTRLAEKNEGAFKIDAEKVKELIGHPKYLGNEEIQRRTAIPGVATGLAWTPVGGEVLFIESTRMPGAKGFQITGSVGNVMQESAQAALSYIRSHAHALGIKDKVFQENDLHLHIPAGATPKDGPSAGVTIVTSLVSLLTGTIVKPVVGMTGEITLRGQVLPVGGIKEKVLAAHRAGLKTICLPNQNMLDLDDLPNEIRSQMKFIPVETIDQVLSASLGKNNRK